MADAREETDEGGGERVARNGKEGGGGWESVVEGVSRGRGEDRGNGKGEGERGG